ncbi:ammonium transporter [Papillibacter cinnamivorans]|uniref:Ammonium transporter, Amt family n=1 Tax=Papillibacter cinnamivorans DSM 12816 TaxID=1122930 RepID=A0A1W2C1Z4_9FIRM|nr:ammonium transporter [Papillibacter cinnamivorans]SMC78912.1 ammonium transporter, Amt family [Papillibacter cinnamivorans DSM 12816]
MKKLKKSIRLLLLIGVAISLFAVTAYAAGGDPTGASYSLTTGSETVQDVAAVANKAYFGANYTWVMICAFMVFFFQCGFAMVETGFCRGKNAAHTMTMNFMVFLVGAVGYFLVGFALQFGGSGGAAGLGTGGSVLDSMLSIPGLGGILGYKGFMLSGTYDAGVYALFFFQMVFMDTTVTIPTGAMAERVKYSAVVITSFFISMIFYPLFGNWVWGGGWLAALGANFGLGHGVVDFAGSGVVHSMGGMLALSGAIVIGPRIGKFKKDGSARAFPGHNIPMAIIGTIILFFCWFSFNAGSTLNSTDFRLSVVATNTMIAGAIGGLVAMFYMWGKYGKPDPSMTANGTLAGLVAITAPCAFVNGISAFIIGLIAGLLVCVAVPFIENKLKLDDPVGAISVHGVNGFWGIIALGLFADGRYGDGLNGVTGNVTGLFFGDAAQLGAQLVAILVLIVYGFGVSFLFFKLLDKVWGLRVSPEAELEGLDIPEMGVLAYPDQQMVRSDLDYDSEDNAPIRQLERFAKSAVPVKPVPAPAPMEKAVPVEVVSAPSMPKSGVKITKVDIITKQSKFEALKAAMNEIGVTGMTVTQVLGCGVQKGKPEYYRGVATEMNLLPKVEIEIVVSKVPVRTVIDTAKKVLYTGHIGDGKIFVYDVENVVKVRTGEEGYDALQDSE